MLFGCIVFFLICDLILALGSLGILTFEPSQFHLYLTHFLVNKVWKFHVLFNKLILYTMVTSLTKAIPYARMYRIISRYPYSTCEVFCYDQTLHHLRSTAITDELVLRLHPRQDVALSSYTYVLTIMPTEEFHHTCKNIYTTSSRTTWCSMIIARSSFSQPPPFQILVQIRYAGVTAADVYSKFNNNACSWWSTYGGHRDNICTSRVLKWVLFVGRSWSS